jgi:hypothetical protein
MSCSISLSPKLRNHEINQDDRVLEMTLRESDSRVISALAALDRDRRAAGSLVIPAAAFASKGAFGRLAHER